MNLQKPSRAGGRCWVGGDSAPEGRCNSQWGDRPAGRAARARLWPAPPSFRPAAGSRKPASEGAPLPGGQRRGALGVLLKVPWAGR